MENAVPYWRLSFFYFFYFALLGGLLPYWPLYLKDLGFDAAQIGILFGIMTGTRIIAPNLWGWLADRSGQRVRIIRSGALMTLVTFAGAFWLESFWGLAVLMLTFTFFWNAVLPQFEAITINALGSNRNRYSRIRLWGSIGFICAVIGLGWLLDWIPIRWLVAILWSLMVMIWLLALLCPEEDGQKRCPKSTPILRTLRRPEVWSFLLVCLLIQLSHGPYYSFFSLYMADLGYDKTAIGLLWALGVVAEVAVFWQMHRLLEWTGLRAMLLLGLAVCVLRWLMIGAYAENLPLLLIAQTLHAVTFGCLHAVGIALIQQYFEPSQQGQGQALYSSVGFGMGGALGAFLSGQLWEPWGGSALFYFASLASLLALLIAGWGMRRTASP